jgi:hypothetical protein
MDLSIQRYCTLLPGIVSVNGKKLADIDIRESPEKSLVQTYRNIGLDYIKFFKMDDLSKLAVLAAEIILKDTELYGSGKRFIIIGRRYQIPTYNKQPGKLFPQSFVVCIYFAQYSNR